MSEVSVQLYRIANCPDYPCPSNPDPLNPNSVQRHAALTKPNQRVAFLRSHCFAQSADPSPETCEIPRCLQDILLGTYHFL
jgi:hypothetical protein